MPAQRKTGKQVSSKIYEVKLAGRPSLWRFTITDFDKRDEKGNARQQHGHYDTPEEAEEKRREACDKLEERKVLTLGQAIRLYELEKQRTTPKSYACTIQRLGVFFGSVLRTSTLSMNEERFRLLYAGKEGIVNGEAKVITEGLVHRVVNKETGKLIAADSHRGYLAEAKTFLRWAMAQGYIRRDERGEDWTRNVKGQGRRRKGGLGKRRITRTELDQVYVTAYKLIEDGDRLAKFRQACTGGPAPELRERATCCLFALLLGMRSQEIRKLRVRDINTRTWLVETEEEAAKTHDSERTNEVPAGLQKAIKLLMEGKSPEMYLFGRGDKPRCREWPLESVQAICEEAGVRRETAHGLRGAHRDVSLEAGATGPMVDRQLGHTSGSDTGEKSYQTEHGTKAIKRAKRKAAQAAFETALRDRGSN